MKLQFLYPADPLNPNTIDSMFSDEALALKAVGHFVTSDVKKLQKYIPVLYRGWMLTIDEYKQLYDTILMNSNCALITTPEIYKMSHYISEWYELVKDHTFNSVFSENFESLFPLPWENKSKTFVKDYVKSLTTTRGSVAKNRIEIVEIINDLRKYRGFTEGGICLREFQELQADSEKRYFVFYGSVFDGKNLCTDTYINYIATKIKSKFFTIDMAKRIDGSDVLVEIGDGQVSDLKDWACLDFANIF